MVRVSLRGVKRYRHPKSGIWYTYYRPSGQRLFAEFGSPEFLAEYNRAVEHHEQKNSDILPGTLGLLIAEYRQSDRFGNLAEKTRQDYMRYLNFLRPIADMPLIDITRPFVSRLRDKAAQEMGWRSANYTLAVLSAIMAYGLEYGIVADNTVKGVRRLPRPRGAQRANRPWGADEQTVFLTLPPRHIQLPVAVALFTGMRIGDVLRLDAKACRNDVITWRTSKTGKVARIPILGSLREILKRYTLIKAGPLCLNSKGRPWTRSGFSASFRKYRDQFQRDGLVSPGLTLHGLRHTMATMMKEAGVSDDDAAIWLAHSDPKMTRRYNRDANTLIRMRVVARQLEKV